MIPWLGPLVTIGSLVIGSAVRSILPVSDEPPPPIVRAQPPDVEWNEDHALYYREGP